MEGDVRSAVFLALTFGSAIAGGLLLAGRPRWITCATGLLIVLTAFKLDRVFFSVDEAGLLSPDLGYRGYDRGLQVLIGDALLGALAVALLRRRQARFALDPWLAALGAYVLIVAVSLGHALDPAYASWELLRSARWLLLGWVLLEGLRAPGALDTAMRAVALIAAVEIVAVLVQRYALGQHRVSGTYGHPNSLGMAIGLIFPFLLAASLRARGWPLAGWCLLATGAMGAVVCTLSRSALVMLLVVLILLPLLAALAGRARPRLAAIGLLALLAVPLGARARDTAVARFFDAPDAPRVTRQFQNDLAREILDRNPFGVGANNFPKAARVHVRWQGDEPGALDDDPGPVHNAYLLEAAETGWPGLVAMLAVGLVVLWRGIRLTWKRTAHAWLGPAVTLAVVAVAFQSLLEWAIKQTEVFALFVVVGAIAGAALEETD
jgi:O-antigen ligase